MSTRPSARTPWKGTCMCRRSVSVLTGRAGYTCSLGQALLLEVPADLCPQFCPPPSDMLCVLCARVSSYFCSPLEPPCLSVLVHPTLTSWALESSVLHNTPSRVPSYLAILLSIESNHGLGSYLLNSPHSGTCILYKVKTKMKGRRKARLLVMQSREEVPALLLECCL